MEEEKVEKDFDYLHLLLFVLFCKGAPEKFSEILISDDSVED